MMAESTELTREELRKELREAAGRDRRISNLAKQLEGLKGEQAGSPWRRWALRLAILLLFSFAGLVFREDRERIAALEDAIAGREPSRALSVRLDDLDGLTQRLNDKLRDPRYSAGDGRRAARCRVVALDGLDQIFEDIVRGKLGEPRPRITEQVADCLSDQRAFEGELQRRNGDPAK